MHKLLAWLLPAWARPDHPLLQYEFARLQRAGRQRVALHCVVLALALAAMSLLSWLVTGDSMAGQSLSHALWRGMYFPLLVLQAAAWMAALAMGMSAVESERQRRTWDSLRATQAGAGSALRARWIGILYRLRAPIAVMLAARALLAAAMLYELAAFDFHYSAALSARLNPPLPDPFLALPLIALVMAVNFLLPLISLAAAVAFGMLVAVALRARLWTAIVQVVAVATQVACMVAGALYIAGQLEASQQLPPAIHGLVLLVYSALGDWALQLAYLGRLGEVWAGAEHGGGLPPALGIWLLTLAWLADGMMRLAESLSEGRG